MTTEQKHDTNEVTEKEQQKVQPNWHAMTKEECLSELELVAISIFVIFLSMEID